jgi:predicted ATPase
MLREMAEVVEALTAKFPLILVLEDLHWSDYSTLDLISALARRHEQPRLMLVGTYRPVELLLMGHPLRAVKRELQVHHCCEELPRGYFTQDEVSQYLSRRFPSAQLPADLPRLIYEHTDGHPLFMVNVVDYWLAQGWLVQDQDHWELKGSSGNLCVNSRPLRDGMKTPTVLHGLSHIHQTAIGGDFSSSHLHGSGSAFELLVQSFNGIGGA